MKVKVELIIETDFYDEEIFNQRIENLIKNGYVVGEGDSPCSLNSKLEKFDMYIVEEKK